jgi:hypothetical protein
MIAEIAHYQNRDRFVNIYGDYEDISCLSGISRITLTHNNAVRHVRNLMGTTSLNFVDCPFIDTFQELPDLETLGIAVIARVGMVGFSMPSFDCSTIPMSTI